MIDIDTELAAQIAQTPKPKAPTYMAELLDALAADNPQGYRSDDDETDDNLPAGTPRDDDGA